MPSSPPSTSTTFISTPYLNISPSSGSPYATYRTKPVSGSVLPIAPSQKRYSSKYTPHFMAWMMLVASPKTSSLLISNHMVTPCVPIPQVFSYILPVQPYKSSDNYVDDFLVKHDRRTDDFKHLCTTLQLRYPIKIEPVANRFLGIRIQLNRHPTDNSLSTVTLDMPLYAQKGLASLGFKPTYNPRSPIVYEAPKYGAAQQFAHIDTSPLATPEQQSYLRAAIGLFRHMANAVDNSLIVPLSRLASKQSCPTQQDMLRLERLLNYIYYHPNAQIIYRPSDMQLHVRYIPMPPTSVNLTVDPVQLEFPHVVPSFSTVSINRTPSTVPSALPLLSSHPSSVPPWKRNTLACILTLKTLLSIANRSLTSDILKIRPICATITPPPVVLPTAQQKLNVPKPSICATTGSKIEYNKDILN